MNLYRGHGDSFWLERSGRRHLAVGFGKIRHLDLGAPDRCQLFLDRLLLLDLLLQLQNPLHERFWAGWATWHVNVHRHDLIDPFEDVIAMCPVRAPTGGAAAHRDA